MNEKTLELLGSIQRFFGWLIRDANLHDKDQHETVREVASSLSTDIEDFIDQQFIEENDNDN